MYGLQGRKSQIELPIVHQKLPNEPKQTMDDAELQIRSDNNESGEESHWLTKSSHQYHIFEVSQMVTETNFQEFAGLLQGSLLAN